MTALFPNLSPTDGVHGRRRGLLRPLLLVPSRSGRLGSAFAAVGLAFAAAFVFVESVQASQGFVLAPPIGNQHSPSYWARSSAVSGDFNGDQITDLMRFEGHTKLFAGIGQGEFAPQAVQFQSSARISADAVMADVDGDGFDDVVFGGSDYHETALNRQYVYVWSVDRNGLRGLPARYSVAGNQVQVDSIKVTDLDGDGDLDVFVELTQDDLRWISNRGDGTFDPPRLISWDQPGAALLGLADTDSDGLDDLIVSRFSDVFSLRNLGGGQFGPYQLILTPSSLTQASLAVADLNRDGHDDLLMRAFSTPNGEVEYFENDGAGGYSLTHAFNTTVPLAYREAGAAIDLNGDGWLEILRASGVGEIEVFEGLPGGGWSPSQRLDFSVNYTMIWDIVDLNADGLADITFRYVDASNTDRTAWRAGQASGPLLGPAMPILDDVAGLGPDVSGVPGSFDGDVDLEFISGSLNSSTDFLVYDRAGEFYDTLPVQLSGAEAVEDLFAEDLNQDGLDDLLILTGARRLFLATCRGGLQFDTPVDLAAAADLPCRVADLDGDGALDIVLATSDREASWLRNQGGSSFASPQSVYSSAFDITAIRVEDVNGDQRPDILVSSAAPVPTLCGVDLVANTVAGFASPVSVYTTSGGVHDTALGDIDGDGRADLLISLARAPQVLWKRSLAQGAFAPHLTLINAFSPESVWVEAADLNDDGATEVLIQRYQHLSVALFDNDGAGGMSLNEFDFEAGERPSLKDVDGDGDLDVVITNLSGGLTYVHENQSANSIGTSICGPAIPNVSGQSAQIRASASGLSALDSITIRAEGVPITTYGFFIVSGAAGTTFPVPGSVGRLCLTGTVGRYLAPGQIGFSTSFNSYFYLKADLESVPGPAGMRPTLSGETLYFQAWFRDGPTSNFTDAIAVTLQ